MKKYKTRRGESWESINNALTTLVRRQAQYQKPLEELQKVYEIINLCKRYEHEMKTSTIAGKLKNEAIQPSIEIKKRGRPRKII